MIACNQLAMRSGGSPKRGELGTANAEAVIRSLELIRQRDVFFWAQRGVAACPI